MPTFLRHNLSRLVRFSGRDRRGLFWPYAGLVLLLGFVGMNVSGSLVVGKVLAVQSDPAAAMIPFLRTTQAGVALVVALLAAAVTRRLHDRGRTGLWGLPPVVLLVAGMIGFERLLSDFMVVTPSPGLFLMLMLNNLAYFVSLIVLTVLLCLASDPRDNRYGPAQA